MSSGICQYFSSTTPFPSCKDTGIGELATCKANGSVCWRSKPGNRALRSRNNLPTSQTLIEPNRPIRCHTCLPTLCTAALPQPITCSSISRLHAGGVAHEGLYQTKGVGRAVLTHEVGRGVVTRQLLERECELTEIQPGPPGIAATGSLTSAPLSRGPISIVATVSD